jgi:hypothetical protein
MTLSEARTSVSLLDPGYNRDMNSHVSFPPDAIENICTRYHIQRMQIFGSALREDFGPHSDIDVLVEFEPDAQATYYELVELQDALADLSGRKVDILTPGALSQYFRQKVLDQAQVIYERTG